MWIISAASAPRFPLNRKPHRKIPFNRWYGDRDLRLSASVVCPRGTLSPATGLPIEAQQVQDMVDRVMTMEEGTRAHLLAPIVRDRKGNTKEFLELRKQGFQRVKVDGEYYELDEPPTLDKKFAMTSTLWWIALLCVKGWKHALRIVSVQPLTCGWHRNFGNRSARGRPRADHIFGKFRLSCQWFHDPRN